MGRYTNVVFRGRKYYLRVAVPADLRAVLRRKEVWKSLRRADEKLARQAANAALAALHADWDYERRRLKPAEAPALTDEVLLEIVADFYHSELALDERNRARLPTADDLSALRAKLQKDAREVDLSALEGRDLELAVLALSVDFHVAKDAAKFGGNNRRVLLRELRKHSANGETVLVRWAADEALRHRQLAIPSGGGDRAI